MILCSHVLPGVEKHIDRAMIMGDGKQLALGKLEDLRQESQLPIEIKIYGIAANDLPESLLKLCRMEEVKTAQNNNEHTLWVSIDHKMTVLRELTTQPNLRDIEIKEASLQALYSHYTRSSIQSMHGESSVKEMSHG